MSKAWLLGLADGADSRYQQSMSSESLKEFIVRRRAELDAAEQPVREQLDDIAREREELRRAALAAGIETVSDAGSSRTISRSPRRLPEKTIKDAVIEALDETGRGMTALGLLARINNKYGVDYPRTSLSPQLTRLKNDGKIERRGNVWYLLGQAPQKAETADHNLFDGNGPAASNPTGSRTVEPAPGGGTSQHDD